MLVVLWAMPVAAQQEPDGDDGPSRPTTELTVTARRLDAARANIEPSLGASTYAITNDALESRPSGETTTIGQILLQAPGTVQDGSGQLHVRQSQGNLQYRINNVILPEGLADLGESLSPRIAARVQLVTGALPAQYGLQAGGVVNITTKDGVYLNGGQLELYGGSHGTFEPAFEYGGSVGRTNFFASGSYQRNDTGIASPDGSAVPLHDHTDQLDGFAYVDRILDAHTRVSLIIGSSDERFQLPNRRGLDALTFTDGNSNFQRPLTVGGIASFPSEQRDDRRRDITRYAVLSLLRSSDKATLQVSTFARYSSRVEQASGIGDLLFTGIGRDADDRDTAFGLQVEGVYDLGEAHTLRGGVVASGDTAKSTARTLALPVDAQGRATTDVARTVVDTSRMVGRRTGVFVQDEWRPLDGLTVNLGVRFDQVEAVRSDNATSPRLSLVWTSPRGFVAHSGYARYFLPAPTESATETAAGLARTTAAPPGGHGDPLRPETDDYYDVGIQQSAGGVVLGIDTYWRQARNLIGEGQFGSAYLTRSFNYGAARIRGVELTATYTAVRFSGWSNLAVTDGRGRSIVSNQFYFTPAQLAYLTDHSIPLTQTQTVTVSGGASYRWDRLRVSTDLLYGSGLRRTALGDTPNAGRLPGYVQLNLAAVYRIAKFKQRPLDLRLDILNVLDRKYQLSDGSSIGNSLSQWGARRGFFAGLEQAF